VHTTIHDVAAKAGVSTATVSRALRGLPHVSDDTRLRVEAVARELNYVVSVAASGLASGRTKTIGVAAPFLSRWFFGEVLDGIEDVLRGDDMDALLYNLGSASRRSRFFGDLPMRRRVDGLIVLSLPLSSDELAALRPLAMPVVVVGLHAEGFSSVRIDDIAAATSATQYLIDLGHRRIAMLGDSRYETIAFRNSAERRHGYRMALLDSGLVPDPALDVSGPFGLTGGSSAMADLLNLADPPTAVFAAFDEMAFGAIQAITGLGLRVPEDVSVIGVDDHEMSEIMNLTTIRQPVHEQGRSAARLLLEMLDESRQEPIDLVLPTELIVRGSAGPVRRGSKSITP
jgi:LacI family transcriptional regulator, repressor for deo operon, udp, cdd, tsx, nupC, and nupG